MDSMSERAGVWLDEVSKVVIFQSSVTARNMLTAIRHECSVDNIHWIGVPSTFPITYLMDWLQALCTQQMQAVGVVAFTTFTLR